MRLFFYQSYSSLSKSWLLINDATKAMAMPIIPIVAMIAPKVEMAKPIPTTMQTPMMDRITLPIHFKVSMTY